MKKISLAVIFTLITIFLFAQAEETEIETKETVEISEELFALQTANNLAKYGYSIKSPSALIGAAEILARIQTQPVAGTPESDQGALGEAVTPEFTPENLLKDARDFAGKKNKIMLNWAKEVEKNLNAVRRTRGAIGGPKTFTSVIAGYDRHVLPPLAVEGVTEFLLVGSGTSDLDLYIFDEYGNLVAGDEGHTDTAFIGIRSSRPGALTVVVKNQGSNSNRYMIITN